MSSTSFNQSYSLSAKSDFSLNRIPLEVSLKNLFLGLKGERCDATLEELESVLEIESNQYELKELSQKQLNIIGSFYTNSETASRIKKLIENQQIQVQVFSNSGKRIGNQFDSIAIIREGKLIVYVGDYIFEKWDSIIILAEILALTLMEMDETPIEKSLVLGKTFKDKVNGLSPYNAYLLNYAERNGLLEPELREYPQDNRYQMLSKLSEDQRRSLIEKFGAVELEGVSLTQKISINKAIDDSTSSFKNRNLSEYFLKMMVRKHLELVPQQVDSVEKKIVINLNSENLYLESRKQIDDWLNLRFPSVSPVVLEDDIPDVFPREKYKDRPDEEYEKETDGWNEEWDPSKEGGGIALMPSVKERVYGWEETIFQPAPQKETVGERYVRFMKDVSLEGENAVLSDQDKKEVEREKILPKERRFELDPAQNQKIRNFLRSHLEETFSLEKPLNEKSIPIKLMEKLFAHIILAETLPFSNGDFFHFQFFQEGKGLILDIEIDPIRKILSLSQSDSFTSEDNYRGIRFNLSDSFDISKTQIRDVEIQTPSGDVNLFEFLVHQGVLPTESDLRAHYDLPLTFEMFYYFVLTPEGIDCEIDRSGARRISFYQSDQGLQIEQKSVGVHRKLQWARMVHDSRSAIKYVSLVSKMAMKGHTHPAIGEAGINDMSNGDVRGNLFLNEKSIRVIPEMIVHTLEEGKFLVRIYTPHKKTIEQWIRTPDSERHQLALEMALNLTDYYDIASFDIDWAYLLKEPEFTYNYVEPFVGDEKIQSKPVFLNKIDKPDDDDKEGGAVLNKLPDDPLGGPIFNKMPELPLFSFQFNRVEKPTVGAGVGARIGPGDFGGAGSWEPIDPDWWKKETSDFDDDESIVELTPPEKLEKGLNNNPASRSIEYSL